MYAPRRAVFRLTLVARQFASLQATAYRIRGDTELRGGLGYAETAILCQPLRDRCGTVLLHGANGSAVVPIGASAVGAGVG